MIKTFTNAKVQLMMIGEGHEKGVIRTFSHAIENASDEQIAGLGNFLETISGDHFDNAVVSVSHQLDPK
ncbi:hypothetical protein [Paucilactobacillus sp. N302-9]|jgi:DNA gyrase/topoisomerase IV subunit B